MNEKFNKWFDDLTFDAKLEYIKQTAMGVVKNRKRYNNALEKEKQYNGLFTGKGKGSTLFANTEKIAKTYNDQLDILKYSVGLL